MDVLIPPAGRAHHHRVVTDFFARGCIFKGSTTRTVVAVKKDGSLLKLRISLSNAGDERVAAIVEPIDEQTFTCVMDGSGRILRVDEASLAVTGYSAAVLRKSNIGLFCNAILEKIRYGTPAVEVQHANGRSRSVNVLVSELQESIYSCTFEQVNFNLTATLRVSADGKLSHVTPACISIFGYSPKELQDKQVLEIMPRFSAKEGHRVIICRSKDSSLHFVEIGVIKLTGEDDSAVVAVAVKRIQRNVGKFKPGKYPQTTTSDVLGWYKLQKRDGRLGEGTCGTVHLAYHRLTGTKVAIKTLSRVKYEELSLAFPPREIQLLTALRHPNICYCYNVIENKDFVYLPMELCTGDLFEYAMDHGALRESEARDFFRQIVSGVDYMHSVGVCHRDLKLENILLIKQRQVKIIDVGLGNFFSLSERIPLKTFAGSPDYAAPELWERKPYDGPMLDVFALGVILFVLTCNALPFDSPLDICKLRYDWPDAKRYRVTAGSDCKNLVDRIFQLVEDRLDLEGIIAHPFVTNNGALPELDRIRLESPIESLDHNIVLEMEVYGFTVREVRSAFGHHLRNQITATYWMLFNQQQALEERASSEDPNYYTSETESED